MKHLFKLTLFASFILAGLTPLSVAAQSCNAQVAQWLDPADGSVVAPAHLFDRAAGRSIVLLGEVHDNPDHHRWQHYMLAALHARNPDMVVGFEMLPRRAQAALDAWSAGSARNA